jgi:hypothetical protein
VHTLGHKWSCRSNEIGGSTKGKNIGEIRLKVGSQSLRYLLMVARCKYNGTFGKLLRTWSNKIITISFSRYGGKYLGVTEGASYLWCLRIRIQCEGENVVNYITTCIFI